MGLEEIEPTAVLRMGGSYRVDDDRTRFRVQSNGKRSGSTRDLGLDEPELKDGDTTSVRVYDMDGVCGVGTARRVGHELLLFVEDPKSSPTHPEMNIHLQQPGIGGVAITGCLESTD